MNSANGEESEESADEEEDEFGGWLVGDDVVEEDAKGSPADSTEDSTLTGNVASGAKRKIDTTVPKEPAAKKRKVVPLVPFIKGPCWENTLGECEYEQFQSFRIQLLNGTLFAT